MTKYAEIWGHDRLGPPGYAYRYKKRMKKK